MKKAVLIPLFLLLSLLSSCEKEEYKNNYSAQELCQICNQTIAVEDAVFADADSLLEGVETPVKSPQIAICYSANANNLDEFGIWKTDANNTRKVATFLNDFLLQRYQNNQAFYDSYIPEETPKLRDAEVRVYGNYVIYAILSPQQKKALFQALGETLVLISDN